MKNLSIILVLFMILAGCNNQHNKLNKIIEKADKVEVIVFDNGSQEMGIKAFESTDPQRIRKFKAYFTNKHTPTYKYAFTGKFVFTSGRKSTNILFNLNPESTHIAYMIDYSLYTMKLSDKGLEFLKTVTTNLPKSPVQQDKTSTSEQTD